MGSRVKEEEKLERIVRGLAKKDENRKCINCGALGPQYVCTNFSIFVCTNCSGIHREFTHRVKSISMSKFSATEVAALQDGGNEGGRDLFLKNWDSQRFSLPDSSNPDKLREFIKAVYVDRRYSGDKPLVRGKQGEREDSSNPRRSGYRSDSYLDSQSPSSEDRFETSRYGGRPLSRGSDGGRYEDRGLNYEDTRSPGRLGPGRGRYERNDRDPRIEDRFANEGIKSPGRFDHDRSKFERSPYSDGNRRYEDRFANEVRDPRRANDRPPAYPDYGSESSPPVRSVREILGDDIPALRIEDNVRANGRVEDVRVLRSQAQPRKDLHTASFGSSQDGGSNAGTDVNLKQDYSVSLIDFGADSETPAAPVQSDPFGFNSLQPHEQSSSTGWASFDVHPGSQSKSEMIPGAGAAFGADPFKNSQVGLDAVKAMPQPVNDSWPSNSQPWVSVNPAMASHSSNQNLPTPAQAGTQSVPAPVSSVVSAPPSQYQGLQKPQIPTNERPEIPEDLFTPLTQGSFSNMGTQLGPQFLVGGPSFIPQGSALPGVYIQGGFQASGQHSKSRNPFDLPEETTSVPSGTFSNMSALQAALPNMAYGTFSIPANRTVNPQWSHTVPVNQQLTPFPQAALPGAAGYLSQQPAAFMPPLHQYPFAPASTSDQFAGYQHGPQLFVPPSSFGAQSSTHPVGGNPFD